MKPTLPILIDCAEAFKLARRSVYEGARLLHRIYTENLWEGHFESYSEFLEEDCGISKGYASRLLAAYQYYVVDNGFSEKQIEGTDHEKLYYALKLPGTAEKKLIMAQTLTRRELKDELASDENGDCPHTELIQICARCGRRV